MPAARPQLCGLPARKTKPLQMFSFIVIVLFATTAEGCRSSRIKVNDGEDSPRPQPVILVLSPMPPLIRSTPLMGAADNQFNVGDIVVPLILDDNLPLGRVTVGSPESSSNGKPQEFAMFIDITSSEVWLPSDKLCDKLDCNDLPFRLYSMPKGQTDQENPVQRKISKIEYAVSGVDSSDVFKLGAGENVMVIEKQYFLEVNEIVREFKTFDGMLGLGLFSGSKYKDAPVWRLEKNLENIIPVFGIYINRNQKKELGSLVIGGNDGGLFKGEIHKHAVQKASMTNEYRGWNLNIDKLVVIYQNGDRKEVVMKENTATPSPEVDYISLPLDKRRELNDLIFEFSKFDHLNEYFDCAVNWMVLPDVAIVINSIEYVLKAEDYVRPVQKRCRSSIGVLSSGKLLLGRPFMKKFYTMYDVKNREIHFAESSGVF